jgi:hypothetical protein
MRAIMVKINLLEMFSYGGRDITKFLKQKVPSIYGITPAPKNCPLKTQTEDIESIREALSRHKTGRLEQG